MTESTRKHGAAAAILPFKTRAKGEVAFNRAELEAILNVYGRKVAAGEWRDYAIDHLKDRAVFSVFRRASEVPLYRIEKNPHNTKKHGPYSIIAAGGAILKQGQSLKSVLKAVDKPKK